jgi:hypothetical protein
LAMMQVSVCNRQWRNVLALFRTGSKMSTRGRRASSRLASTRSRLGLAPGCVSVARADPNLAHLTRTLARRIEFEVHVLKRLSRDLGDLWFSCASTGTLCQKSPSEHVSEPAARPVSEPAARPVSEPAARPVSEPAARSVSEPVADLAAGDAEQSALWMDARLGVHGKGVRRPLLEAIRSGCRAGTEAMGRARSVDELQACIWTAATARARPAVDSVERSLLQAACARCLLSLCDQRLQGHLASRTMPAEMQRVEHDFIPLLSHRIQDREQQEVQWMPEIVRVMVSTLPVSRTHPVPILRMLAARTLGPMPDAPALWHAMEDQSWKTLIFMAQTISAELREDTIGKDPGSFLARLQLHNLRRLLDPRQYADMPACRGLPRMEMQLLPAPWDPSTRAHGAPHLLRALAPEPAEPGAPDARAPDARTNDLAVSEHLLRLSDQTLAFVQPIHTAQRATRTAALRRILLLTCNLLSDCIVLERLDARIQDDVYIRISCADSDRLLEIFGQRLSMLKRLLAARASARGIAP